MDVVYRSILGLGNNSQGSNFQMHIHIHIDLMQYLT